MTGGEKAKGNRDAFEGCPRLSTPSDRLDGRP